MQQITKLFSTKFTISFLIFIFFTIVFYTWVTTFHSVLPFNRDNYMYGAHHYLQDPRLKSPHSFDFLRALGVFDAQWYLRIADKGYPYHPNPPILQDHTVMGGASYAFFPLFPLLIAGVNFFFHHIELSAFFLTNVLLLADFVSLYFLIRKIGGETLAYKTIYLLFLYPMAVFFHTYFTESLYLFLLIWFTYFLYEKKLLYATICLALLNVTKATGWLLNIYLLWIFWQEYKNKSHTLKQLASSFIILIFPALAWMLFCWYQTSNPFYFLAVRSLWSNVGYLALYHNLSLFFQFDLLPFHYYHHSKLDILSIFTVSVLLFLSWKKIPHVFWWISFCLFLSPLLVTDTMSYSRYQIVSFPLFLYLAKTLPHTIYCILIVVFSILLVLTSLLLVNWYWLG